MAPASAGRTGKQCWCTECLFFSSGKIACVCVWVCVIVIHLSCGAQNEWRVKNRSDRHIAVVVVCGRNYDFSVGSKLVKIVVCTFGRLDLGMGEEEQQHRK